MRTASMPTFDSVANALQEIIVAHPIVAATIALLAARVVYLVKLHPLADVPGPRIASLTEYYKVSLVWRANVVPTLRELHAKYGDVVRIAPNEVSIRAPDEVKNLYGHRTEYLKGPFYEAWKSSFGYNHFSEPKPSEHALRRREVANAYSMNALVNLEEFCDPTTRILVQQLEEVSAAKSNRIDIGETVLHYAFDIIGEIAFGSSFGILEGKAPGLAAAITQTLELPNAVACTTHLGRLWTTATAEKLITWWYGSLGPKRLQEIAGSLVMKRFAEAQADHAHDEPRRDMLWQFMNAKSAETSKPFDFLRIVIESVTVLGAGADTTAISLRACLFRFYNNPDTLKRLRAEIQEALESGALTFPVTYAQATKLSFFQACLKEALRLHPAVGWPLQRVVPAGGREIAGRFYAGGTLVGMSAWMIHYDERAYGKDAEEWKPDRWLTADRNDLERYNLAFGQGSRVCVGKNISLMEMSKVLPVLIHLFDFDYENKVTGGKLRSKWFTVQTDQFVRVHRREETKEMEI